MNVSIDRALEILSNFPILSNTEVINLDNAHNRILSEDMNALVDSPPFDNSSIDGWAILDTDNPMIDKRVEDYFCRRYNPPSITTR